ncbi:MAG: hypothetical protein RIQ41_578 [Candidatus Parcubacteria bacterium]|jgi:hypothetical protein
MNTLYIAIGIGILWSLYGYFASHVEQMKYSVLEQKAGYEIRLYEEHIVAQTTVKGTYQEALNEGFRIVAGYIFGGNTKKEKVAMTAPVLETRNTSESIAMTTPVLATIEGDVHTVAFGMPRAYTRETLPTPTDPRVEIVVVPEKKMAVMRFSFLRTNARVESKKEELLELLRKDGISIVGEPQYAGYNAPWTPPWMARNEILVEIK